MTKPLHGLLADDRIGMRARELDEQRDAFVSRQLAQRRHRLPLHFDIRIVVDGLTDDADGLRFRAARDPEERALAQSGRSVSREVENRGRRRGVPMERDRR